MEYIDRIIDIILNNFDFAYMLIVNLLTYFVIKFVDIVNKEKPVSTLVKRIVLIVVIILCGFAYWSAGVEVAKLINSSILAPVAYSWIFRPILIKLGVGYKQFDDYLLMKDADNEENK